MPININENSLFFACITCNSEKREFRNFLVPFFLQNLFTPQPLCI